MVYDDAEKLYAEIRKDGEALFDEALHALFPSFVPLTAQLPAGSALVGLNTTFLPRRDIVKVPLGGSASALQASVLQTSRDGKVGYALMSSVEGADVARAVTSAENVDAPRGKLLGRIVCSSVWDLGFDLFVVVVQCMSAGRAALC